MACNSINSTIEIFTVVLLLVLLVSVLIKKRKRTRLERLFMVAVILHIINTLGDLAAWRFTCQPGMTAFLLTNIGNFLTYFVGALAYFLFLVFVYTAAAGETKLPKWGKAVFGIIFILCLFQMGLTVYNLWSGSLYTISADNTFTWGAWSGGPDNVVLVQLLLMALLILWTGSKQKWKGTGMALLYLFFPAFGALIENWQPYLMLLYPTFALSLLLIYVTSQQNQEKQLMAKELELAENRIRIMVSQIQPHFLYNSLNSIYHLCGKDPEMAQKAISDFSDYLRMNLKSIDRIAPIPFEEELAHVKTYLKLEKMRFEEELTIVYEIAPVHFMIPALTIQPLVENAVKHGIYPRESGGTITIAAREHQKWYEVRISDDGVGFWPGQNKDDGKVHIGIPNVRQRLWSMCRAELEIDSRPGVGTVVVIKIPKEKREDA